MKFPTVVAPEDGVALAAEAAAEDADADVAEPIFQKPNQSSILFYFFYFYFWEGGIFYHFSLRFNFLPAPPRPAPPRPSTPHKGNTHVKERKEMLELNVPVAEVAE